MSWLIAQTSPEGLPVWIWPVLAAAGTFLATLMSGKIIVPTFAYLRERDRADRLEKMREEYAAKVDDQVRPALEASRLAIKESAAASAAALQYTKELQAEIVQLRQELAVLKARQMP